MQKLPIKSTDRNSKSNDLYNIKNEEVKLPPVKTKTKNVLNVVLIILAIIAGTAICTTIVYFGFLSTSCENSEDNQIGPNSVLYAQNIKKVTNNKIEYKCTDILNNCKECDEVLISNEKTNNNDSEKKSLSSIICTSCEAGFYPIYNNQNIILFCNKQCDIGDSDLCKTCDTENQNQCGECNNGFYLPIDEMIKSKCKKCSDINNKCKECYGTKDNIKCLSCSNNYLPFYNNNNELIDCNPICEIGDNELCKTCDKDKNQCTSCNEGYYLPEDDLYKLKCKKCSDIVKNCNKCHGEIYSVTCDEFN